VTVWKKAPHRRPPAVPSEASSAVYLQHLRSSTAPVGSPKPTPPRIGNARRPRRHSTATIGPRHRAATEGEQHSSPGVEANEDAHIGSPHCSDRNSLPGLGPRPPAHGSGAAAARRRRRNSQAAVTPGNDEEFLAHVYGRQGPPAKERANIGKDDSGPRGEPGGRPAPSRGGWRHRRHTEGPVPAAEEESGSWEAGDALAAWHHLDLLKVIRVLDIPFPRSATLQRLRRLPPEQKRSVYKQFALRWHPDKLTQRYRGKIPDADSEAIMERVTHAFQVMSEALTAS